MKPSFRQGSLLRSRLEQKTMIPLREIDWENRLDAELHPPWYGCFLNEVSFFIELTLWTPIVVTWLSVGKLEFEITKVFSIITLKPLAELRIHFRGKDLNESTNS